MQLGSRLVLKVFQIARRFDATNLAASQNFIPKYSSATPQTWQNAKLAEKKLVNAASQIYQNNCFSPSDITK